MAKDIQEGSSKSEEWKDDILTMPDILKEQEEHEATFQAVLGGSDANSCTYSKVSFNCFIKQNIFHDLTF